MIIGEVLIWVGCYVLTVFLFASWALDEVKQNHGTALWGGVIFASVFSSIALGIRLLVTS